VYEALVDSDALVEWLPPAGMSGRFERFDLWEGGSYRLVLTYADATGAPGFVALVPGERVVWAVDFVSDDPAFSGTMTMTWTLVPIEGGCRVEVAAAGVPGGISPEDHAAGMQSSLDNLAAYLDHR
jgi:uncharacterized protein YndB with AHSA1/START domain